MSRERKFALGDRLLALLFPERCLFCRKPVDAGQCFCSACEKKVPIAPLARRLEAAVPGGAGFSCRSPLSYRGEVVEAMRRFKFQGKKGLAKPFARLMARAADFPEQPELVTFVPLSKNHRRERGYNQSEALAEELGRLLNLPVKPVLEKVKENKTQHLLSAKERRQNVRNVYRASSEVHGKKVLLVDDIVTTGATLRECAGQLYRAGAEKVFALCAADAELGGGTGRREERQEEK